MKEYVNVIKEILKGVKDEDRYAMLNMVLDDLDSDIYIERNIDE